MKKYLIFTLLLLIIYIVQGHNHRNLQPHEFECVHEEKQKELSKQIEQRYKEKQEILNKYLEGDNSVEDHIYVKKYKEKQNNQVLNDLKKNRRNLATSYVFPEEGNSDYMRIGVYTDILDGYSESVATAAQKEFIKKQLDIAVQFYQTRFKVVRTVGNLQIGVTTCSEVEVPADHQTNGIADTDFYVYVTAENNSDENYLAWALYCEQEDAADGFPARPTFAELHYNTAYMTDLTDIGLAQALETSLHEIAHALGFSSSLYNYFRDRDATSDPAFYSGGVKEESVSIRGESGDLITTPNVRKWASDHFGCLNLNEDTYIDEMDVVQPQRDVFKGMQLENQGSAGSKGSHWERTLMYDEIMTASRLGPTKTFSGLTFALFKDAGFYLVDDSNAEPLTWGYNKGCEFVENACLSETETFEEFCEYENEIKCTGGKEGKGSCVKQNLSAYFMDATCGLINPYNNARCIVPDDSSNDTSVIWQKQTYSFPDSRCFESSLNQGVSAKCYEYECLGDGTFDVIFSYDGGRANCASKGQELYNVGKMSGLLVCPDPYVICEQNRKFCPDWCSGNGYCTDGVCNCKAGTGGNSCELTDTECGADINTQFYDYTTDTCISENTCCADAVNGCAKYPSKFNRVCQNCSTLCATCLSGGSNKCKSCVGSYVLFILDDSSSEGQCLEQCPDGYYDNSGTCQKCDVSCENCNSGGCLSCPGTKILDETATPLQVCVDDYTDCNVQTLFDQELRACVTSCSDGKINQDNLGFCVNCPDSTYKHNDQCITDCPDEFYGDDESGSCQSCVSPCHTCFGPSVRNCIICESGKFQFGSTCVDTAEQCPYGSYGDADNTVTNDGQTYHECKSCPDGCLLCSGPDSSTDCTECKAGYYLVNNQGCAEDCPQSNQFKETITKQCMDCDSTCATCSKELETRCLSCYSDKKLLVQGQSKTCVTDCPESYFSQENPADNFTCVQCFYTCKSCTGKTTYDCIECNDQFVKYTQSIIDQDNNQINQTQCLFKCPDGYYEYDPAAQLDDGSDSNSNTSNVTEKSCLACHESCKRCNGFESTNCTLCYDDEDVTLKFLNDGVCVEKCPEDKVLNIYTNECYANLIQISLVVLALLSFILI